MNIQRKWSRVKAPDNKLSKIQANLKQKTNDVESLKPKRMDSSDNSKNKGKQLLSCKVDIQIATKNVRTIRTRDKICEMVNNVNKYKLNILRIIDHKIVHKNNKVLFQRFDNCTLIKISDWKKFKWSRKWRFGLLISKTSVQAQAEVKTINDLIVIAVFNGNPKTTVVINYAPIEGCKESEEHYYNLTNLTNIILTQYDYRMRRLKCSFKNRISKYYI